MERRSLASTLLALLLVAGLAAQSTGRPPRPDDENGLTENESATLWSRDNDSGYISNAAYREAYGENRTAIHQLANGTDISFRRPPSTAARWTRADHREFTPGDAETALYPPHANTTDGTYLRDAHATIFAVGPATTVHVSPNQTRTYAAPNGTVRGVVDYRVVVPAANRTGNTTVEYTLVNHTIEQVRLHADGRTVTEIGGTPRPVVRYTLPRGETTLRLTATITAQLRAVHTRVVTETVSLPNGTNVTRTRTERWTTQTNESLTVTDRRDVEVYRPTVNVSRATYPDGNTVIAAFHRQPWQGLRFGSNTNRTVRGVWRFYTARDPRWDTLVRANATGSDRVTSPALPVTVHAYPSRFGPRAEPVVRRPDVLETWGPTRRSPAQALPETVRVDVVEGRYTTSAGLSVAVPPNASQLTARGIVRGVEVPTQSTGLNRDVRRSRLSLTVLNHTADRARLLVELVDERTGEPIDLGRDGPPRDRPPAGSRAGVVTVAGNRVRPNASGEATVTVTSPGVYTARYRPGSWLNHDPAYAPATATARWHPLATPAGLLAVIVDGLQWFLPFLVVAYAGRRLGTILRVEGHR